MVLIDELRVMLVDPTHHHHWGRWFSLIASPLIRSTSGGLGGVGVYNIVAAQTLAFSIQKVLFAPATTPTHPLVS
jgi:hypothetical protein